MPFKVEQLVPPPPPDAALESEPGWPPLFGFSRRWKQTMTTRGLLPVGPFSGCHAEWQTCDAGPVAWIAKYFKLCSSPQINDSFQIYFFSTDLLFRRITTLEDSWICEISRRNAGRGALDNLPVNSVNRAPAAASGSRG